METTMIPNIYVNNPKKIKKFHLLGLAGTRKSGKDWCANILTKMDTRFKIVSFADALKYSFADRFNIKREDLDDVKLKEKYRRRLQTYSIDMKKEHGEFVFVNTLINSLEENNYYVIPDVRFLCELQSIVVLSGVVYKVHTEPHMRSKRGWKFDPVIDNDISETEIGSLSSDTFKQCCDGGYIFNTLEDDESYVSNQLREIVRKHFPASMKDFKI